jgi:hypothetical protein
MVNPIPNSWLNQIPDKLSKRLDRQPIMVVTSLFTTKWEHLMKAAPKARGEPQTHLQEVPDLDEITLPHTELHQGLGQQVSIAHAIYHRVVSLCYQAHI